MKKNKFDVVVKVKYYKWKQVNNKFALKDWLPWIKMKNITVTNAYEIRMNSYYENLLKQIERFQGKGSGCRIVGILSCNANLSQYTPLRGSSYIDLSEKNKNKQCCMNVKNKDNKCFIWTILSALHHNDIKRELQNINYMK